MAQLWSGRRKMADLLINVSAEKSIGFTLEVGPAGEDYRAPA